ncbi:MAG: beta-ketoacyl-[acyl-carrier-protein] synthase family protein [Bacteroidaceae bacterium]|nr:beta-ketoacyl-[acyl-carrier-protein] synthase family protein [Bacteroidaceae bacterium]
MNSVSITGFGIICAIGNDAAAVLSSLQEQRTGIAPMRYLDSIHKGKLPVGEVKLSNEEMKGMLGLDENAIVSRTVLMGAIAIRQALNLNDQTTKRPNDSIKGKRIVVISGTTVGGMDITERYFQQMQEGDALLPLIEKHAPGSSTREMACLAGLKDAEVCTVSTACSSAVNAIILGSEMLRNDEADIVIAGGTEALSRFHLNGFGSLMLLDGECCRPFDKTRAGLNLGEGAAFVVLQKNSSSSSGEAGRGLYIRGYANRCDAFHQTASSENGEGAYLAMSEALQMAGLKPQDIQYINAHGTGTPNNDSSESAAIRRVFREHIPPVSSTKGFTGHATSASGAIETVICILALQHNFLPVNLGWKEQDEACITPFKNSKLINSWMSLAPRRDCSRGTKFKISGSEKEFKISNILCNSFGFGGNDSALVISQEPSDFAQNMPVEVEVLADERISDVEQLSDYREFISPGEARRMTRLMKAAIITSLKALRHAGIESPDAIITATAYGMLETSEKFLIDMLENGEETLSPTLFMQSTHNTLSSAIAIRTNCHGYNITYSQGKDSLDWALRDARRLIASGKAKTVLVGCHDEATPTFQSLFSRMGKPIPPALTSRSIVLTHNPHNS